MSNVVWADRGQRVAVEAEAAETSQPACMGVARLGSLQCATGMFTVWIQLRGTGWIESREGRFRLRGGEWIAFDRESRPLVQADRNAFCIGLNLDAEAMKLLGRLTDTSLYTGRGRLQSSEARVALRLWREAGALDEAMLGMQPVLLYLASLQRDFGHRVQRCPGRSRNRKRQVFGRLQRARLFLEGNSDRIVRIGELAALTNFSSWYFSKTFQGLYEESPQALSARLRLERAADLLRDTDMMIGEVAAASGFDNCCSFARAFRAHFGVAASTYRKAAARLTPDSAKPADAARKAGASTRP
ncbi:AraC family transcriptional regulator [Stenotrophomonas sp. MMGLT7]|uniref:helix-turn-helix domain-containing protein n=1 Tax=Stenotrophomonas sp. MMGLT7 TaxID=2901227 RepID=UPI001E321D3D|nr:AraC family transcriptional regulator [Stenotrophomonas sp. MMGLT7]MCD7097675.1 AraC family transcriptional regulator [Stenotrophomonas sp. MMGLT7]